MLILHGWGGLLAKFCNIMTTAQCTWFGSSSACTLNPKTGMQQNSSSPAVFLLQASYAAGVRCC